MDAMQLAQMKRTAEWQAQEVHHTEHDLQAAELALEGAKKKVEELRKKLTEGKRKLQQQNLDVMNAQEEVRRKIASERH
jgi:anti-sigma28 factor (negative regulator of flagellin synthesis)